MTWRTAVLVFALVAWGGALGTFWMAWVVPDHTRYCNSAYATSHGGCGGLAWEREDLDAR